MFALLFTIEDIWQHERLSTRIIQKSFSTNIAYQVDYIIGIATNDDLLKDLDQYIEVHLSHGHQMFKSLINLICDRFV